MTQDELAALDAATWVGKKPLVLECFENGVWQIRLIFGEGEKDCTIMRQWADAYRARRIAVIDDEAVKRAARAICNAHCEEMYGVIDSHMVENEWADWVPEATAAIAALGVK
jgi:hypothetical protein